MIRLPAQIRDAVIAHARFCAPLEACGLLALDADGQPRMAYCLTNVARSQRRFTVSPQEHFMAIRHAEHNGWTIGGAFHSHPQAAPYPSATDIAGALDSTWLHLIVGPVGVPRVRAYRIEAARVSEIGMEIV